MDIKCACCFGSGRIKKPLTGKVTLEYPPRQFVVCPQCLGTGVVKVEVS